jgi:very-short-patch-repair endonuclease
VDNVLQARTQHGRLAPVDDEIPAGQGPDLFTLMNRLGGVASRAQLKWWFEDGEIAEAVENGEVLRTNRGRYALPTAEAARVAAHRLSAVVGLRSAAASWGWALKDQPPRPEIIVPRGRKVSKDDQAVLDVRWRRVAQTDLDGWRTTPVRTVMDCATTLPLDEALAVADSALRARSVSKWELLRAAEALPGRGRDAAVEVAWHASAKAANPFESVIRAVSLGVPGLRLEPQAPIRVAGRTIHPDLVDRDLRLVVEADSHEFHTKRDQITHDCWRYDELALDDWLVLRVSWVQAMHQQAWVRSVLERAVDRQQAKLQTTIALARGYRPPESRTKSAPRPRPS